ncbi:MAG: polyprenyl synthetase family protein [Actinomycetes bacterium]
MSFSPSSDAVKDIKLIRDEINQALGQFIKDENQDLARIGSDLDPVSEHLEKFLLDSGKRLRPIFAYIGYLGAAKNPTPEMVTAFASLELVHVCALIHDDVMDGSDTRRGAPAIHKSFEKLHRDQKLSGSAQQFGVSAAILLGDLALIWSDQMLHNAGLSDQQLINGLKIYDEMRVELMAGQYLDVYEQALASNSVERALKVARFKSGKYTIERPLHFGAAIAGSHPSLEKLYSDYGIPLGEAFQLRDDLLGVFGDSAETGKPSGDDLREGKRTVLMAIATEGADKAQLKLFEKYVGNPDLTADQISQLQEAIIKTGAVAKVEKMIQEFTDQALAALNHSGLSPVGKNLLTAMASIATKRST